MRCPLLAGVGLEDAGHVNDHDMAIGSEPGVGTELPRADFETQLHRRLSAIQPALADISRAFGEGPDEREDGGPCLPHASARAASFEIEDVRVGLVGVGIGQRQSAVTLTPRFSMGPKVGARAPQPPMRSRWTQRPAHWRPRRAEWRPPRHASCRRAPSVSALAHATTDASLSFQLPELDRHETNGPDRRAERPAFTSAHIRATAPDRTTGGPASLPRKVSQPRSAETPCSPDSQSATPTR